MTVKNNTKKHGTGYLQKQFAAGAQPFAAFSCNFPEIINGTDGSEPQGNTKDYPYVAISQIRPEEGGVDNGEDDKHTPHGGNTFFLQVGFRTIVPDHLTKLEFSDEADKGRGN
jgi:hypothetical protein